MLLILNKTRVARHSGSAYAGSTLWVTAFYSYFVLGVTLSEHHPKKQCQHAERESTPGPLGRACGQRLRTVWHALGGAHGPCAAHGLSRPLQLEETLEAVPRAYPAGPSKWPFLGARPFGVGRTCGRRLHTVIRLLARTGRCTRPEGCVQGYFIYARRLLALLYCYIRFTGYALGFTLYFKAL